MKPTTQEEANEELRLTFSSYAWQHQPDTRASGLASRVLEILQAFPALAKEHYESGRESNLTPLVWLCCIRACATPVPMRIIEAVYDLYPMAAADLQGDPHQRRTPLDLACQKWAPRLVIQFLMDRFRPAIYMKNPEGLYPVETLFQNQNWRSQHVGMELMLELCPGAITRDLRFGDNLSRNIFEEALARGFSNRDLKVVAQKFPPDKLTVPDTASMHGEQGQLVLDLIPKLQSLSVHSVWSQAAIEKAADELCVNQSIKRLELVLHRPKLPIWNRQLQRILARNRNIETLQLKVSHCFGEVEAPLSNAILQGLCCNGAILELELDSFDRLDLQDNNNHIDRSDGDSRSAVRQLVLKNCSVSLHAFFRLLRIFPHLTKLNMENVTFEGEGTATTIAVHILDHCNLTSFSIKCGPNTQFDAEQIGQALRRNECLKHLGIAFGFVSVSAQEELVAALDVNTTLEDIDPLSYMFQDPERIPALNKVKHLLELNKRGRGQVRSSDTSLENFVQLLVPESDSHGANAKQEHQIQHGLLHEGLMLWSG